MDAMFSNLIYLSHRIMTSVSKHYNQWTLFCSPQVFVMLDRLAICTYSQTRFKGLVRACIQTMILCFSTYERAAYQFGVILHCLDQLDQIMCIQDV
jgi:hypothetical protein